MSAPIAQDTLARGQAAPADAPRAAPSLPAMPTVWGLDWFGLHTRYWASKGIQIVRSGEKSQLVPAAELYLLLDQTTLTLFRPASILDAVSWMNPDLIICRVLDKSPHPYAEQIVTDEQGQFVKFQRLYNAQRLRTGRVLLTHDRDLAGIWQETADPSAAWQRLRGMTRRTDRFASKLRGRLFDGSSADDVHRFGHELVSRWQRPDATISRIRQVAEGVWADKDADVKVGAGVRGPLWIGAGRSLHEQTSAVGPAVLWDEPAKKPATEQIEWEDVESLSSPAPARLLQGKRGKTQSPLKRVFDIACAGAGLLATLPVYPVVCLAILIEDGRPFFFAHRRETLGGREFGCLKFRSMRKDSEQIKARLMQQNQADGPQFFIKDDPRLTKVGRFIREYQIDELPQLWNVLRGDMSMVGPRPSPFKENQFSPAWREARLSVRPGLTGLWQVSRTREEGNDFQEWIKYDIKYVENQSFRLDLWIIWRTFALLVRRATKS
jgi:lipopolysaccharide/colanic/teichoic acid biosynthesis glycosyltransferase